MRNTTALAISAAFVFAACGGDDVTEEQPTTIAETIPETIPETTPETTPAPETTQPVEPEPETEPAGEPELVWSVDYEGRFNDVIMHPNGELVAIADDATYLHQLADGELIDALVYTEISIGYPEQIAYGPDGTVVLTGLHIATGDIGSVVTDPTGELVTTFDGGFQNRIASTSELDVIATSDRSGEIVLYDAVFDPATEPPTVEAIERARIPTPADLADAGPVGAAMNEMRFTPDDELLVAQYVDAVARVYDVDSLELVSTIELDGEIANRSLIAVSPDGALVAAAVRVDGDQTIRIWPSERLRDATVEPAVEFEVIDRVRDLSWSPDGSLLAVASRLGTTIWDVVAGELAYSFDEEFDATATQQPLIVAFTPDGGHLLIARGTPVAELWRLPGADVLEAPERIVCEPIPVPGDVLFDTGSAALRADADEVLAGLAAELADTYGAQSAVTLTFIGHTDSRGSAEANQQLSTERARAVADYFETWAAENDVTGWELETDGRGDTELKVIDVDANGNFLAGAGQLNRRVDIEIDAEICA